MLWLDRALCIQFKRPQECYIDIDATDDPTCGKQQLSMFNGYYGKFMYNELFFHDGDRSNHSSSTSPRQ